MSYISQTDLVQNHLLKHGTINARQAEKIGITHPGLAVIIHRLRTKRNMNIGVLDRRRSNNFTQEYQAYKLLEQGEHLLLHPVKNPTEKQLVEQINLSRNKAVRRITDALNGDVYIWPTELGTHTEGAEHLKIPGIHYMIIKME
jgi:hypothetical protein